MQPTSSPSSQPIRQRTAYHVASSTTGWSANCAALYSHPTCAPFLQPSAQPSALRSAICLPFESTLPVNALSIHHVSYLDNPLVDLRQEPKVLSVPRVQLAIPPHNTLCSSVSFQAVSQATSTVQSPRANPLLILLINNRQPCSKPCLQPTSLATEWLSIWSAHNAGNESTITSGIECPHFASYK